MCACSKFILLGGRGTVGKCEPKFFCLEDEDNRDGAHGRKSFWLGGRNLFGDTPGIVPGGDRGTPRIVPCVHCDTPGLSHVEIVAPRGLSHVEIVASHGFSLWESDCPLETLRHTGVVPMRHCGHPGDLSHVETVAPRGCPAWRLRHPGGCLFER